MTDRFTVRAVVVFLGVFALLGLLGLLWLIHGGADPQLLAIPAGLAGTALGALGTLLASTSSSHGDPSPVEVVNDPAQPVPVDPQV